MTTIINGREVADGIQAALKDKVKDMAKVGKIPGLVVILVGSNPASQTYVRNKKLAAEKIGIHSVVEHLPENTTEAELLEMIDGYNHNEDFHGILVQLPLPKHIDAEQITSAIWPKKDVDGFHPVNIGRLFTGDPLMIPCTPYGIMKLFAAYDIPLAGKRAVVVGRSNIVGKPLAQLLLMENATVTIAHSQTVDLPAVCREADILIAAIGQARFITKEYVKPGAVVIDVGMNHDANHKLCGDVDEASVLGVAGYLTPVPKGVGPMTITMLMEQTVRACERHAQNEADLLAGSSCIRG